MRAVFTPILTFPLIGGRDSDAGYTGMLGRGTGHFSQGCLAGGSLALEQAGHARAVEYGISQVMLQGSGALGVLS